MTQSEIKKIQEKIGAKPDGYWGRKSIEASEKHLRNLMPKPHPFPPENKLESFYGPHGVEGGFTPPTKEIRLPFTLSYDDKPVKVLRPHEKCADSLLRVFERLAEVYPNEAARRAAGILTYGGLYNPRLMRGSTTTWSRHAWAIAIDLNPGKNGNTTHWPTKAVMPFEVMECFAREGWLAAGAFWNRDAMHFQATQ